MTPSLLRVNYYFVTYSGTKPSIQGWKDLTQDLVVFMKFFHDPEDGLRDL